MNREQRRAVEKKARKNGMSKELAKTYAAIASGTGEHTKRQDFEEGEAVQLNVPVIKARKNYERMSPAYKEFVERNEGVVFHAHIERQTLVSLLEEPKWWFWSVDLIKVKNEGEEEVVGDEE